MDDRMGAIEVHYRKVAKQLRWGGIVLTVAVVAGGLGLKHNSDSIQQQRADSIRSACEKQNADNGRLKREFLLNFVPPAQRKDPAATKRLDSFVDILAPTQNCDVVVRNRTGQK